MSAPANHGTPSAHRVCPSLYAATKLARLVLRVKERLKARMKSRRPPAEASVQRRHDKGNARVLEDAKYAIRTRFKNNIFSLPSCKSQRIREEEIDLPTLLNELHAYTLPGDTSMIKAAEDDELFLKQDAQKVVKARNRVGLCHIVDVTTLLLNRLQHLPGTDWSSHGKHHEEDQTSWTGSKCPKTVANLEHLLRCLQQAAYVALISDMLRAIEADLASWQLRYWQQSRAILHGWFSEWPNGQRPLNTTWPWNVKPSLVILWGVCWMFYGDSIGRTRKPPSWTQPQYNQTVQRQQQLVTTPQPGNWSDRPVVSPYLWYPTAPGNLVNLVPATSSEIPFITDTVLENPPPSDQILWPTGLLPNSDSANLEPVINHPNPSNSETLFRAIGAHGGREAYGQQQKRPSNDEIEKCQTETGLVVPSYNMVPYPSPFSEVSPSVVSPRRSNPRDTPVGPEVAPPSIEGSLSPAKERIMGTVDAVDINDKTVLRCDHKDCAGEPPEFARRCEYKKHKDKHLRPYICREPGCEKIRGFTYAGGLLRHEREVHRRHGGPKSCYKCPHPNCKRSSGTGFSRKENLTEHLRRVHRKVGEEPDSIINLFGVTGSPAAEVSTIPLAASLRGDENRLKRRWGEGENYNNSEGADSDELESVRDLHLQINFMKKRQENTDERLRMLESQIAKLSAGLRAFTAATTT